MSDTARPCVDCGRDRTGGRTTGKGLCHRCYERHRWSGDLADYPLLSVSRDVFVEEYRWLRRETTDRRLIAQRLGMSYAACDRAYRRAVKAGELP